MKRALIVTPIIVLLLIASAWGVLALLYAGHEGDVVARAVFIALFVLGSIAAFIWLRPLWRPLAVWSVAFLAILVWWNTLKPSNDRDWQPDVEKISWAEVRGDQLTFHNVRDFDYRSETDFTPRYEDRVYDLLKLRGLDLFMSYWGSPAIAHTIMSWDFEGSRPLAISIETRKSKGQEYSAVKGFFRHYEIIYIAADERDVIRLRTNYRGEDDYLYRLKVTPVQARALLMDYIASMNALVKAPQFYNALVDNCTTSIRQHVTNIDHNAPPLDWRLLANGYGDQMLYERGRIDTRLPFEELRARSYINAKAKALDRDPGFSQGIREGLPDPRSAAN